MKKNNKNNELKELIIELRKASIQNKVNIWKRIAEDLEKPSRRRRTVNVYKLNKVTNKDETVIVPGKVLGTGEIEHSINVAAYNFSKEAMEKIKSKGKALTITELIKKNPKGEKVRIIG